MSQILYLLKFLDPQSTIVGRNERHAIIQAYLRKKRSEEEVELLLAEMEQSKQYFEEKLRLVISRCTDISAGDLFNLGTHSILTNYQWKLEQCLLKNKESVDNTLLDCELSSDESRAVARNVKKGGLRIENV